MKLIILILTFLSDTTKVKKQQSQFLVIEFGDYKKGVFFPRKFPGKIKGHMKLPDKPLHKAKLQYT